MKRIVCVLLLLLLLTACGAPQPEGPAPGESAPTEALPEPTPGPAEEEERKNEEEETTVIGDNLVTMDGLASYLRLSLPEGWRWEKGKSADGQESILLIAPTDDGFRIRVTRWESFGMCGTGVDFREIELPNGKKATLATESSEETVFWTLILPANPDQFTMHINASQELIDAHQAEIDQILGSLQSGVLARPQTVNDRADY